MAAVEALISDARGFANTAFNQASTLVSNAEQSIQGLGIGFSVSGAPEVSYTPVKVDNFPPDFFLAPFVPPTAPREAPALMTFGDINPGAVPINTAKNPGFISPPQPAPLHALNFTAPTVNTSFTFPDAPSQLQSISLNVPTVGTYAAPAAPQISIPNFDGVRPTDSITSPTDYADKYAKAYRDIAPVMVQALDAQMDTYLARYNPQYQTQLAAMEAKIAKYIAGGTALAPAVENALYERGRDKNNAEARRARDAAYKDAAKRGLTLPDGALYNAAQVARQQAADNNARAAVEITIKQAELEQQNVQFAITTSSQLRTAAMSGALSYHSSLVQLNGQALSYAQSVLSAAIEIYNAFVRAFEAKLEAYKADAQVYEVRLRGITALIDIYRAEISAIEALTRVDLAKIEGYKAQIESLQVLANVYRIEVETVQAKAQVERLKIDIFGAQVQAYATEAQAKNAEWSAYSAAIGGQTARIQAYGEEVRAYLAQVEGFKASISAKQTQVQSIVSYNTGILSQYTAGVEAYRATVAGLATVQSAGIEYQKTKLLAFQAKISAEEANARLGQQYYQGRAQTNVANFEAVAKVGAENAKIAVQQIEAVANTAIAGARVYEGIAGAALQGMNTLVTATSTS